jgi:hypothetical protein
LNLGVKNKYKKAKRLRCPEEAEPNVAAAIAWGAAAAIVFFHLPFL